LTTRQAAEKLKLLIKPFPSSDEMVLCRSAA
jgi:hypothetical protein